MEVTKCIKALHLRFINCYIQRVLLVRWSRDLQLVQVVRLFLEVHRFHDVH